MKVPAIYFFCCEEEDNLQDDIIILAEGLKALGIPFYSRCDYWLQSTAPGDFLFRATPEVSPDDCDIVVFPYTWFWWVRMDTFDAVQRPFPPGLFKKARRYKTVYMDTCDGHRTVSWGDDFRQFDIIFRTKLNKRAWHPDNFEPWAMGLSDRIIAATENAPQWGTRRSVLLSNFGASHPFPHGARTIAEERFNPKMEKFFPLDRTKDNLRERPADPVEELLWRQTGRRHCRAYFERLKTAQAVSCFCGELIPPMPWRNPESYLVGGNRAKIKRLFYEALAKLDPRPPRSVQWDSFRFWEALAAGSLAFNLDLDRYGVEIPVMPENWKHYIGIDLDHVDRSLERLQSERHRLATIAEQGRQWALDHYSPTAMAKRFLLKMGYQVPEKSTTSVITGI